MRLHIGGVVRKEGWTVLNAQPGPHVDVVGDFSYLAQIGAGAVEEVYASHVLEHLRYADELPQALAEIFRILRPAGKLMAAVPDLEILCKLFIHPQSGPRERWDLMRIMFGGQIDAFDLHKAGLWTENFGGMLHHAGFVDICRVESFGLFQDASLVTYGGVPISLNMEARKPA